MNTIKVNKTTTEVVEVEVKFPSFYKKGDSNFAKIINEKLLLHVWHCALIPEHANISYSTIIGNYIEDGIEITEDEFLTAYNKVLDQFGKDANGH